MLVSLEVRAPFLDYRIVNFSFKNIPGHLKVKAMTLKYLLKKLARKVLPRELNIKENGDSPFLFPNGLGEPQYLN